MPQFTLSAEERELRALAKDAADRHLRPVAAEADRAEAMPVAAIEALFAAGLLHMGVAEEDGGSGLSLMRKAIVVEELARACPGIATIVAAHDLALTPIARGGTADQRARHLAPLCAGPNLAAFALTEPESGSDAASLTTRAARDGGGYRLTGRKQFITNGGVARLYTVFATVDPALGARGITPFIVPAGSPGLSAGRPERKLGIRASQTTGLTLEDVPVPAEDRLGAEGEGFALAMATVDRSRVLIAAASVGLGQGALDLAIGYARSRRQFGRPIIQHQAVAFMLADAACRTETARLLTWRAAEAVEAGAPDATMLASMAKLTASEAAFATASDAVQVHGGYGFLEESGVAKYLRDAKIFQIFEGTNQIQRLVIGRHLSRRAAL